MNAEQLAFLLELIKTPGLNFPLEKCKLAYQTQEALTAQWQKAVEAERESADAPPAPHVPRGST